MQPAFFLPLPPSTRTMEGFSRVLFFSVIKDKSQDSIPKSYKTGRCENIFFT